MEKNTPAWLTKEYIARALKEDGIKTGDINVLDLEITKPIPEGNNYASDIYRAKIRYTYLDPDKSLTKSLIIKAPVTFAATFKGLQDMMTKKEMEFYKDYLPKVNRLLSKHNEDLVTPLSYVSSEKNVLILEDLNVSGYEMTDRLKGLDYEHSAVALKALAKYHAASVKLHESEPELVESLGKEIFFGESGEAEHFVTKSFEILAGEVKLSPNLEKYSGKLKYYSENVWERMKELMRPKSGRFHVLNHGDFWVANMLFKFSAETKKPVSVKLVDLQLSRYTSPALDLIYFLHTSLPENIRLEHSEELIDVYFKELANKLELFETKLRITREELYEQLKERDFFEMIVGVTILPWILADPDKCKIVDVKDVDFESADNIVNYFKIEPYKTVISKRLVEYEEKGWL